MPGTITLLSPAGETPPVEHATLELPAALRGKRVGFLDNTKANFDVLARGLGQVLVENHGVAAVTVRRKLNAATPAPPEVIAALARDCDVVFTGSGD